MRREVLGLYRAANGHAAHGAQPVEGRHQLLAPVDAQNNDSVTLQSGKPVSTTVGFCAYGPEAGSDTKIQ